MLNQEVEPRSWECFSPFWEGSAHLNWEGTDIWPNIRPGIIPEHSLAQATVNPKNLTLN